VHRFAYTVSGRTIVERVVEDRLYVCTIAIDPSVKNVKGLLSAFMIGKSLNAKIVVVHRSAFTIRGEVIVGSVADNRFVNPTVAIKINAESVVEKISAIMVASEDFVKNVQRHRVPCNRLFQPNFFLL
jgi:hypothetical protein